MVVGSNVGSKLAESEYPCLCDAKHLSMSDTKQLSMSMSNLSTLADSEHGVTRFRYLGGIGQSQVSLSLNWALWAW